MSFGFELGQINYLMHGEIYFTLVVVLSNSDPAHQHEILDAMWSMWFHLPSYGRRASQFVDLIGYFTIKCAAGSSLTGVRFNSRYLGATFRFVHTL